MPKLKNKVEYKAQYKVWNKKKYNVENQVQEKVENKAQYKIWN